MQIAINFDLQIILLIFQIISLVVLGVFLLNSISNLWALERLGTFPKPKRYPKISIIVPARNEENNIEGCVRSLLQQDYPDFEVLVLNDHSTDRTGEILKQIKDRRLKIFSGRPLPEDWLGKHWACHQLAEKAKGELILFTDADTVHQPTTLSSAVSAMLHDQADFATALPKEKTASWSEYLSIPIIPWSLLTFMPLAIAKRTKRPSLSATIGQFMLFKRTAYNKIGGYSSIRYNVLDDVTFGRKIRSFGLKWRMYDGSKLITCRMYTSFKQVLEGFVKFSFPIFKNNLIYFFFVWLFMAAVFSFPWMILLFWSVGIKFGYLWLAVASILSVLITWIIAAFRFRYPWWIPLIYPVILAMVCYIVFMSMIYTYLGKVRWKGRKIKTF